MFNIGAGEMVFILIAALLVLGPQRLPELARGIGKFLREFRRQTDEVRSVVVREFYAMDQEVQREPPRIAPPHMANAAPAVPPAEPAALPAPSVSPAPEAGPPGLPSPLASTLSEAAQAGAPVAATTASATEAAPEQEEPLPRFDSIPGTVARNAPKQS
ncbi:MAG: twin-arginine translocase TatA/TatE family subunit [Hyalangium sp.]|uniref:Sec-independent protein translocase subunit TatA/TatB n=1 Tax=Hyalangium sp. TaxID=2028555 RepID=UPI003899E8CD